MIDPLTPRTLIMLQRGVDDPPNSLHQLPPHLQSMSTFPAMKVQLLHLLHWLTTHLVMPILNLAPRPPSAALSTLLLVMMTLCLSSFCSFPRFSRNYTISCLSLTFPSMKLLSPPRVSCTSIMLLVLPGSSSSIPLACQRGCW